MGLREDMAKAVELHWNTFEEMGRVHQPEVTGTKRIYWRGVDLPHTPNTSPPQKSAEKNTDPVEKCSSIFAGIQPNSYTKSSEEFWGNSSTTIVNTPKKSAEKNKTEGSIKIDGRWHKIHPGGIIKVNNIRTAIKDIRKYQSAKDYTEKNKTEGG